MAVRHSVLWALYFAELYVELLYKKDIFHTSDCGAAVGFVQNEVIPSLFLL